MLFTHNTREEDFLHGEKSILPQPQFITDCYRIVPSGGTVLFSCHSKRWKAPIKMSFRRFNHLKVGYGPEGEISEEMKVKWEKELPYLPHPHPYSLDINLGGLRHSINSLFTLRIPIYRVPIEDPSEVAAAAAAAKAAGRVAAAHRAKEQLQAAAADRAVAATMGAEASNEAAFAFTVGNMEEASRKGQSTRAAIIVYNAAKSRTVAAIKDAAAAGVHTEIMGGKIIHYVHLGEADDCLSTLPSSPTETERYRMIDSWIEETSKYNFYHLEVPSAT